MFGVFGGNKKKDEDRELTPAEKEALELDSLRFSKEDIAALRNKFREFAFETRTGARVQIDDLLRIPELSLCPLLYHTLKRHDVTSGGKGHLLFIEFARSMARYSGRFSFTEKLRFLFDLFDDTGTGVINGAGLFTLFRSLLGRYHKDTDFASIIKQYVDRFPEGVTFEVFESLVDVSDFAKLTLNVVEWTQSSARAHVRSDGGQ